MQIETKKGAAYYLAFPMVDSSSPEAFKSSLSPTDTAYYKDGAGSWTSLSISDTASEIGSTGVYEIDLASGEMNHDQVMVKFTAAGAADTAFLFDMRTKLVADLNDLAQSEVTGGAYALDTDANGRIRIVDGTGAGEIDTNAGGVKVDGISAVNLALLEDILDGTGGTGFTLTTISATSVDFDNLILGGATGTGLTITGGGGDPAVAISNSDQSAEAILCYGAGAVINVVGEGTNTAALRLAGLGNLPGLYVSGGDSAGDGIKAVAGSGGYDINADMQGSVSGSVGSLGATAKADVNAEVDAALDTAIPGSPTADSVNERLKAVDVLTEASGAGDLAAILKHLQVDYTVDTAKTPWELVIKEKGTSNELLRKELYQPDGSNVTSADHLVGRHVDTATE